MKINSNNKNKEILNYLINNLNKRKIKSYKLKEDLRFIRLYRESDKVNKILNKELYNKKVKFIIKIFYLKKLEYFNNNILSFNY